MVDSGVEGSCQAKAWVHRLTVPFQEAADRYWQAKHSMALAVAEEIFDPGAGGMGDVEVVQFGGEDVLYYSIEP